MEKRSRGGCLTAFIIVMLIFSAISIFGSLSLTAVSTMDLPAELKEVLAASASPAVIYTNIIFSLITIVSCILILTWRKIGVYLFVASSVISMLFGFFTAADTTTIVIGFVSNAIFLLIFYFLIRNVFKHMK